MEDPLVRLRRLSGYRRLGTDLGVAQGLGWLNEQTLALGKTRPPGGARKRRGVFTGAPANGCATVRVRPSDGL